MTATEFRGPGLTDAQWEQIRDLATSLDSKQLIWVSGFLAGVEQGKAPLESPASAMAHDAPATGQADAGASRQLTVLYGSETGNSAAIARMLAEQAQKRGLTVSLQDMGSYKLRQLKDERDILIVTSTHGEGDPPQTAADFFEFVEGRKAPRLPDLRFAVLALGDSTYERFCEAGKRLDRRLEELGAHRLTSRIDCDIDYDEPAAAWIADVLAAVSDAPGTRATTSVSVTTPVPAAATQSTVFSKSNPFPARVIENIVLTGRGSSKQTRHVELSLEGSGLSFEPGDALGLVPRNKSNLIDTILMTLDLASSTPVNVKGQAVALGDALATDFEITALTPRFLDHWAALSGASTLRHLAQDNHANERAVFARGHHAIDVIRQFPARGINPERFIQGLQPLQPRLYSIASSLAVAPDEVHLTVSTVRYTLHGERRTGVASGYLAEHVEVDDVVPVYLQPAPHFRLPPDEVPIIMIGAGTGIAPYRAFMQEREVRGAPSRSWLFFGDRNFRTDFPYQTEWQALLKDGTLTHMDVAFSRDRPRGGATVYVQHRLIEHARDIFAWLEEGAHAYICGDANRLAPDVHRALLEIIQHAGHLDPAAATEYLHVLRRDHRYQCDVY